MRLTDYEAKAAGYVLIDGQWHSPGYARSKGHRGDLQGLGESAESLNGDSLFQDRQDSGGMVGQAQAESSSAAPHIAAPRKVDGVGHPQFRITVTLRFSDYRRKDPDGCLATIMDCLTHAVGRLVGLVSGNPREKRTVRARSGRRYHPDREDKLKEPIPF